MTAKKTITGMKTLEITNKTFLNNFYPSFTELSNLPSNLSSGNLKYAIKRSIGSLQDAVDRYSKKRTLIFEERAKKDDYGNPKFDEQKNYIFEDEAKRKAAFKELEKLDAEIIELTVYPIRKENMPTDIKMGILMEINLEGFILPTQEELDLIFELEQQENKK